MYKYKKIAINKFGSNYRTTSKTDELIFKCNKCNRDKLYVNISNGLYHCFRCGQKGRLSGRVSLHDVKEKYDMRSLSNLNNKCNDDNDFEGSLTLVPFFRKELTDEQIKALKNRGLTDEDIEYYNICGRAEDNRIQIPNYIKGCFTDVICNWQYDKSKINDKNPKYLNSVATKKGDTLFNYFNINYNEDQIILTEGIFNAITAGKNAVASYGCGITEKQCKMLIHKNPKSILIAYDSDEPGVTGSCNVIKFLSRLKYTGILKYVLLPKGIDINDFGHDNFVNYCNSNEVIIDLSSPISRNLPKLLFSSKA